MACSSKQFLVDKTISRMKYFLQSKSKSTFQSKSCTTLTNNFSKCRSVKRLLQMEMQACKWQVDEINNHQLRLKQACESVDNENQSLNISFWISSFCLVLKTESIEALILKLANQRIFHKLQFFIKNIQKIETVVETVKKDESEKIMDLFQNITTLFASTLNQAQIFTIQSYGQEILLCHEYFNIIQEIKKNIRVFCRIRCDETMSVGFLSECNKTREQHWEETNCQFIANHNSLQMKNKVRNKNTVCLDHLFEPSETQEEEEEEVFESTKQFITSFLDGYSVCIFVKYLCRLFVCEMC
ncbi:ATP binding protein [Reticulomyxa filosa]|uniref:ATP binding protein n=1 Tax=Reticulomyxa filosa TaxID=46433 RepID=X6P1Z8_RETFI|nr:ATP binding protein [Reticulomyxa filosa]|eukprot:ETO32094.1 ATP binding protein [Reticulomyxa filosa]